MKDIYAAFGRGDIPAILEVLSPDVHWEVGASAHGIPWLKEGRGRDAVMAFFQALAANIELRRFEVLSIMASGEWVVALAQNEIVHKTTGKTAREECEPHVWRFDAAGRVISMRHAADTWAQRQILPT